jgi:hypothetical protein
MSERTSTRPGPAATLQTAPTGQMQRKCACGTLTQGAGQCSACSRESRRQAPGQSLRIGAANDGYEREADRVAEQVMRSPSPGQDARPPPRNISTLAGGGLGRSVLPEVLGAGGRHIQRLVEVAGSASAATEVLGHFNALCSNGSFSIEGGNRITSSCSSSTSPGCDCLCDVTTNSSKTITIELFNVSNSPDSLTLHDGSTETVPMPSEGPRTTSISSDPTVHIPAAGSTAILFGAFLDNDTAFMADNTRLLAHELCGHARFGTTYRGDKGDRPDHDATIQIENLICAPPTRGLFNDSLQGESFHQLPVSNARRVFALVDGWYYEQVP